MEEQLITFKTAKLAHNNGFKFSQFHCYNEIGELQSQIGDYDWIQFGGKDTILAPTQSLLQKWLREIYEIHVEVLSDGGIGLYNVVIMNNREQKDYKLNSSLITGSKYCFYSYEDALEEGLFEALKLI